MKCEGRSVAASANPCKLETTGYELFDYCEHAPSGDAHRTQMHVPANHGGDR